MTQNLNDTSVELLQKPDGRNEVLRLHRFTLQKQIPI